MYWCVLVNRWLAQPVLDFSIVISGDPPLSLIFIKCADLTVAGTVRGTSHTLDKSCRCQNVRYSAYSR